MLEAKDTQFRLSEDGVVSFQALESNPLPGEAIARLGQGDHPLTPAFLITDAKGTEEGALQARLEAWFVAHLRQVLELLMALKDPIMIEAPVEEGAEPKLPEVREVKPHTQAIIDRVYDSLGTIPREALEDLIAKLDAEDRKDLRSKRIRLGPILVFIPALNKPAAVRLRALLWSVFNGKDLPASVPNDGMVSCVIENAAAADKGFYQSIGYPLYGPRAIRIDMLDRVICAVYDGADKGKFQAKHQMAEWLGCPIEDLYAILEAMGHSRIQNLDDQSGEAENKDGEAKEGEKPELATFRLKKGKAFAAQKPRFEKKPAHKKPQKDARQDKKKPHRKEPREPRVMSAAAKKVEDSPFAILQQLKDKG
ncbi:MAG: hypothetical protein ACPGRX_02635 [Bdellovibrionales bacterium]